MEESELHERRVVQAKVRPRVLRNSVLGINGAVLNGSGLVQNRLLQDAPKRRRLED